MHEVIEKKNFDKFNSIKPKKKTNNKSNTACKCIIF